MKHLLRNPNSQPRTALTKRRRCARCLANGEFRAACFLPFVLSGLLLLPACVHRRLTINSDPPGGRVLLDGEEVGETPTSVDFTHYGTREIVIQKDGYDTLKILQPIPPPWYQIPGIDFFADNLLPYQLTNRHEFRYQLTPSPTVTSTQHLRDRANSLRSEAHAGP